MANITEVTTKGYFSRIGDAVKGVVFGLILFLGAFGVIYWNEGSVDISEIANTATKVTAESVDTIAEGKLIAVTGKTVSTEKLGDGMFLKPADYLAVSRNVEMYAWVEKSESKSDTNTGGSETTTTTYSYSTNWTSAPGSSSSFKDAAGHANPEMSIKADTFHVKSAKVGAYEVDMAKLDLPAYSDLNLTKEELELTQGVFENGYVLVGKGTLAAPQVGDLRISYSVVDNNLDGTVFGKLDGGKLVTYIDQKTTESLYRLFDGTFDEAIQTMHSEFTMWLWIFRAIGFLMMWIGLSSLFGPISVVLDVLPILGSISRGAIGLLTFIVSLVLSILAIVVSMLLHSLVAMVVVAVLGIIAFVVVLKMKAKKPVVVQA
ncbi:MAG: TMEM43 family protein [Candidatus Peregrinibacteria bacterium]|nr:TMEM43 family protein [Candidatus Peregrinibacteria bacterium]